MKFICDNNLGKLVRLLRIAGFDTVENKTHSYQEMIEQSINENRVLITRDSKLIKKIEKENLNIRYIKIESVQPDEQMQQVLQECDLKISFDNIFTRCPLCNTEIIPVDKKELKGKIPEHSYKVQEEFWVCPACNKYYWAGTHWGRIIKRFKKISKGVNYE